MAFAAIYNTTTGEVIGCYVVPDTDLAGNVGAGQASMEITAPIYPGTQYIDDPGGTPVIDDRPEFAVTIPAEVTAGLEIAVLSVPDGATVVVDLILDGSQLSTETKSGGLGTLDASIGAAGAGAVLQVTVSLWPYQPYTQICDVVAAP